MSFAIPYVRTFYTIALRLINISFQQTTSEAQAKVFQNQIQGIDVNISLRRLQF